MEYCEVWKTPVDWRSEPLTIEKNATTPHQPNMLYMGFWTRLLKEALEQASLSEQQMKKLAEK